MEPSLIEKAVGAMALMAPLLLIGFFYAGVVSLASGLIFYLCWNHGLVYLIRAVGGSVVGITYWNAFFATWVLSILSSVVQGVKFNAS